MVEEDRTEVVDLEVSDAAGAYLAEMLDQHLAGDAIRFVFGLAGLEPQPSAVLPGDTVYEYRGRTVLVLDRTVTRMLHGKTLDIEETDEGPRLRLT